MNLIEALKVNGKVKHQSWDGWYLEYDEVRDRFMMGCQTYLMAPSYALSQDWEPYVAPCKHEPKTTEFETMFIYYKSKGSEPHEVPSPMFTSWCRHCHAKIKSTGWVIDDHT